MSETTFIPPQAVLNNTPQPPQPPQTLRHPSLYFQDGDIALSALDVKQRRHIFRVYRLFLSHHSNVFGNLITAVLNGHSVEKYDGVPLMEMPEDDSAEDVGELLRVIFDISALPRMLEADRRSDAPIILSNLLDMCDKNQYDIPSVVTVIKDHIRKEWPTTLGGWDFRRLELSTTASDMLPEPVSAIQFATDHNLPSVLPAAFYHLAIISTESDWHESRPAAGGTANALPVYNIEAARWFSLSDYNAVRFVKGRDAMIEYYFAHVEDGMEPPTINDRFRQTGCSCDFGPLQTEIKLSAVCRNLDCLQELQKFINRCDHLYRLCNPCLKRLRGNFTTLREAIWENLPTFFRVEAETQRRMKGQ